MFDRQRLNKLEEELSRTAAKIEALVEYLEYKHIENAKKECKLQIGDCVSREAYTAYSPDSYAVSAIEGILTDKQFQLSLLDNESWRGHSYTIRSRATGVITTDTGHKYEEELINIKLVKKHNGCKTKKET